MIDLADHVHTDAYEVPDRITEAVTLRDHACVFPWCTRPARRLHPDQHGCDCDHTTLEPGTYLWTSPLGMSYLRDHQGTTDVNHDRRR